MSEDGLGVSPAVPVPQSGISCSVKASQAVNTPLIWPNQGAAKVHRLVIVCASLLPTYVAFKSYG